MRIKNGLYISNNSFVVFKAAIKCRLLSRFR